MSVPAEEGAPNADAPAVAERTGRGAASLAYVAWAATLLLALYPMRVVIGAPLTRVLGTAVDSVHAVWGLWYLQSGGPDFVYWPTGLRGTVLGGPSLLLGLLTTTLAGAPAGYTALMAFQTAVAILGIGALARRLGGGPWAAPAAALLLLCGRPLLGHVAIGVPEGVGIGWFALAVALGLAPAGEGRSGLARGLGLGVLLGASLVEDPYTIPLVGLAAVAFAGADASAGRWARLVGAAIGGTTVLGLWLAWSHGTEGGIDAASVGGSFVVMGRDYIAEGAHGRAHFEGLLRPVRLHGPDGTRLSDLIANGALDYLGISAVVLAVGAALARVRFARPALLAAAVLTALAFGSFPGGDDAMVPGPYLYVNLAVAALVRPLTQPVRYLVLTSGALAVGGGLLLGLLAQMRPRLALVLAATAVLEAVTVGSPSTRIPSFDVATWACLQGLPDGAVASNVSSPTFETPDTTALALQLVHGQPGTHLAIGGWTPRAARPRALTAALVALRAQPSPTKEVLQALRQQGVRWVLAAPDPTRALTPARQCGGVVAYDLAEPAVRR